MTEVMNLWVTCNACAGTGKTTRSKLDGEGHPLPELEEIDCPTCSGTGKHLTSTADIVDIMAILDDIQDKCRKIKKTCDDIWDKVNV